MRPWSQPLLWPHPSGAVASDPHFAQVVLLMGFEGANGATAGPGMTDESPSAHGVAGNGGGTISTAQFKFGASSLFPGVTGFINYVDSPDWTLSPTANSNQFTVEVWIYITNMTGGGYILNQGQSGQESWVWTYTSAGEMSFAFSTDGVTANMQSFNTSGAAIGTGTWYHVVVEKDATGKIRIYKNGTMYGNLTPANSIFFNSNQTLSIGIRPGGNSLTGYMDELRITKGFARYASDSGYTVPTAAFPRS